MLATACVGKCSLNSSPTEFVQWQWNMNDADCFIAFFCLFFVFHLHSDSAGMLSMLSVIGCFTHTWIQMINNKSDRFRISLSTEINAFSAVTTRMNESQSRHRDVQRILTATVSAAGVSVDLIKRIEWVSSFEVQQHTHSSFFCGSDSMFAHRLYYCVNVSRCSPFTSEASTTDLNARAGERKKQHLFASPFLYLRLVNLTECVQ